MDNVIVSNSSKNMFSELDWGSLTWFAGSQIGNSADMTLGKCVIKPGRSNPLHSHPNCTEILVVLKGRISHSTVDGKRIVMNEGDSITMPSNVPHNAENIGTENAELFVAFNSGARLTKGE